MFADIKSSTEALVLKNAESSAHSALKEPLLRIPSVAADNHLSLKYAEKYFDVFLRDKEGQPIKNRVFAKMQDLDHPFARYPRTLFGCFTFNKELKIGQTGHLV